MQYTTHRWDDLWTSQLADIKFLKIMLRAIYLKFFIRDFEVD